jgi:hypothetical protein
MSPLLVWAVLVALPGGADTRGRPPTDARVVTLVSAQHPRRVTLEWRRIANGATVSLGEQPVTLGARTPIPIGSEERVLRVQEPRAAPRSFFVPAGSSAPSFELGPPVPGGEVFGRVPPRRFRPQAIRLAGAAVVEARTDDDGVFQVSGLSPGRYTLSPVYRGGVAGRDTPVVVQAGRTTDVLALDLPETGAVRVDLSASLCGESDLSIHLHDLGRGTGRLTGAMAPGVCGLEAEGLEAGTWRVTVTRGGARNEPRASADFLMAAGETVDVPLEALVRVAGTVSAGGAPASGLRLVFERAASRWSTATDDRGAYEVTLGPPGEYAVSVLTSTELPSRRFARTFGPGDHLEDVELGPCAIEVSVRAEGTTRLDESVELALFEATGRRVSGRFDLREGIAVFTGLDYGAYTVTGTTASGLRSRNHASAELTAASPSARVELVMARGRGELRVVGADGRALAGARASAGQAPLPERAPGVFDLGGVPMGERLVAHAPDHVPVCRVLEEETSSGIAVALPVAEGAFTLRLPGDAPWREALLLGLTGSDCPVAIDDVEPQVRAEDHVVTIVLKLPRGSFDIALGGHLHAANAPGELDIP